LHKQGKACLYKFVTIHTYQLLHILHILSTLAELLHLLSF